MAGAHNHPRSLVLLQILPISGFHTQKNIAHSNGSIHRPVFHHTSQDGKANKRHALRRDQGGARVERHVVRIAFHNRFVNIIAWC
jgi:hypothetical protein